MFAILTLVFITTGANGTWKVGQVSSQSQQYLDMDECNRAGVLITESLKPEISVRFACTIKRIK